MFRKNLLMAGMVCTSFIVGFSARAQDAGGVEHGNGGGAHVCYTDSTLTTFKSIESYDLWEAPISKVPVIPPWNRVETKKDILERAMKKIDEGQPWAHPGFARAMQIVLDEIETPNFVSDASNIDLVPVHDAKLLLVGHHCVYRQMINWLDPGQYLPDSGDVVLRDETYYKRMNPLSQAALDLHEAAFKVYRAYMGPNYIYGSRQVRKFVAEALAPVGSVETILVDEMLLKPNIIFGNGLVQARVEKGSKCSAKDFSVKILRTDNSSTPLEVTNMQTVKSASLPNDGVIDCNLAEQSCPTVFMLGGAVGSRETLATIEISVHGCGMNSLSNKITLRGIDSSWSKVISFDFTQLLF